MLHFIKLKHKKEKSVGYIWPSLHFQLKLSIIECIFFDEDGNYEQGGDFSYYASRLMNNLLGTGIDVVYVDNDFDEVEIRSHRGDGKIIGTENISRLVKKAQNRSRLCREG